MRVPHLRLDFPSWLPRARRTAVLRFTALYSGLFLVSGASLLAITYVLFERAIGRAHEPDPSPIGGGIGHVPVFPPLHQHQTALQRASAAALRAADAHQLLIDSGIALGIVAVTAVVLGWLVARRVLRPVRTITATARGISASNLDQRLALDGADEEFNELGDTLDDLFARLEATFEAQRGFVANASHELRTPVTRERTLLQVALGDPSTSEVWRCTGQELLASNREQERLIEGLLTLASSEGGLERRDPIELSAVVDAALMVSRPEADRLGIHIEEAIASAPLEGDPRLVERLVANVLDNATQHNVKDGRIQVSTTTMHGRAVFSVTNTGPVIPPGEVERLFQPFQRLDPRRTQHKDGHGLGLSIVRAIATAHHATLNIEAPQSGGLSIDVTFPQLSIP